jgi:hypothetical protein
MKILRFVPLTVIVSLLAYHFWWKERAASSSDPYAVANYIVDKLNDGRGEDLDKLVVDKSKYKSVTPNCYVLALANSPDYDRSCSAVGGWSYTSSFLGTVPVRFGKCALDPSTKRIGTAKGDILSGTIMCGNTPLQFTLEKFVDVGDEIVVTDYWVLDPTTLFFHILLSLERES